jgi:hypothetical protein
LKKQIAGRIVLYLSQGRFKGGAVLRLVLESVNVNGDSYDVKTSSVSRYLKGKGKRTATFIGGGAGGGALIGGLAGGGKGALVGAALGAGAGTAGAAYTEGKEIFLPAGSTLGFKLAEPLTQAKSASQISRKVRDPETQDRRPEEAKARHTRLTTDHISVDSRPFSAQTLLESPSLKGVRSSRGILCIAHRHCVATRFLVARKFSSSTAARLRARCAPPSCEVAE